MIYTAAYKIGDKLIHIVVSQYFKTRFFIDINTIDKDIAITIYVDHMIDLKQSDKFNPYLSLIEYLIMTSVGIERISDLTEI